jgi:hypothetical protein
MVRGKLQQESIKTLIQQFITPLPSIRRFAITSCLALITLGVTTPILAFNEPPTVTSSYEVLEPETWIGKKLPILDYIDIGKSLKKGNWVVLFYHHDCPDCARAIAQYQQTARDLAGNEDFLRMAFIEVPPYGQAPVSKNSPCFLGRLAETKEWFVTTPAVILMAQGKVKSAWEGKTPDCATIMQKLAKVRKTSRKFAFLINKSRNSFAKERG